jgi:hypothetical protein
LAYPFKDARKFILSCDECQRVSNISRRNEMPMNYSLVIEPFDYLGFDFMGPFPPSELKLMKMPDFLKGKSSNGMIGEFLRGNFMLVRKFYCIGLVLDFCAVLMMTDQLGTPREGMMSTAASFPSVRNRGLSHQ